MSDANGNDNITPLFGAPQPTKPRVRRLRLLALLLPVVGLAVVSTVFGMMMAVASDLPDLENRKEFQSARNSVLTDVRGRELGLLTNNQSRVLVEHGDVSSYMRASIIAIEDRRFYENPGVDVRGIGRAFVQDVVQQKAAQGGSTITQQFVKNALQAQDQRTLFQKLREAALAYHLTRKWSKQKILIQYLNSIYFGNGAYGIESAARTYFGWNHPECGTRGKDKCAKVLRPEEAALLAAVVASPSAYDPVAHPVAARRRRDLVLQRMFEQRRISRLDYFAARREEPPGPGEVAPPTVSTKAPYFTTWVRQQLVERLGARRAFEGGLTVRTTVDLDLQSAAEDAVKRHLDNPDGPSAALVAIDNDTGEVRAMVGGSDYKQRPFNLATQGQRQPGSSFKPFILAAALREGIGPGSVWPSRKRVFDVSRTEKFEVNNFEDRYSGSNTLAGALTVSDNSVYAAVGIKVGTRKVARLARQMGIRTPVSSNLAMTLGGLRRGVTPLDMAHAFQTFAADGLRVGGTLGSNDRGPVGIKSVTEDGETTENRPDRDRVLKASTARTVRGILGTVVTNGTGRRAALGNGTFAAGKTGTTENSGDAWFVGFTDRMTVAVWVGYADNLRPMLSEFAGEPVEGGTFPALIWHDFMMAANATLDERVAKEEARKREEKGLPPLEATDTTPTTSTPTTTTPSEGGTKAPDEPGDGGDGERKGRDGTPDPVPSAPQPATPAPAPSSAPAPAGEGDSGGASAPPPG